MKKTRWQTKTLSSDVTTTGLISASPGNSDFKFSNLIPGKRYRISIHLKTQNTSGTVGEKRAEGYIQHNGGNLQLYSERAGDVSSFFRFLDAFKIFTATGTDIEIDNTDNTGTLLLATESTMTLEELNDYEEETSDFA